MRLIRFALVIVCLSFQFLAAQSSNGDAWTWFYRKQCDHKKNSQEIVFWQDNVPPFLQLIFSWNAFRPETGYFSFWIKVRDEKTKQWSDWQKMSEWGANTQRSFFSKLPDGVEFVHVRLETEKKGPSDAFCIKACAHDGAQINHLKAIMANVSHSQKFKSEVNERHHGRLPTVFITDVPLMSQFELDHPRNDGLCSPTSCSMVSSYLIKKALDPVMFAEQSYDAGLEKYGSWPFNMAHAFEMCKGTVWFAVARLHSFRHLCMQLQKGIPVVVSVRGPLQGAFGQYLNGHLLVVTGFDSQTQEVVCNDPAAKSKDMVVKRYALKDFLLAWERSRRLAYLAEPIAHKTKIK